jgi:hypothetical protein
MFKGCKIGKAEILCTTKSQFILEMGYGIGGGGAYIVPEHAGFVGTTTSRVILEQGYGMEGGQYT